MLKHALHNSERRCADYTLFLGIVCTQVSKIVLFTDKNRQIFPLLFPSMQSKLRTVVIRRKGLITVNFELLKTSARVMSLLYSGGCQVQWRLPSTVEGYLAVQWRAIMNNSNHEVY